MRRAALGLLLLALVLGASVLWARAELRGSLAQLEGTRAIGGLSAPVRVARDALGIPVISGRTREDVARATGFVHGQDRYFQMDLSRRRAAGELAALVGPGAVPLDREIRRHRFRAEARQALALMSPRDRAVLDAYVAGVNSGLGALDSRPFEYFILQQRPDPWLAEDSLLVVLSMFITLQDPQGEYEATLATMHDVLPPAMFDFLTSPGTEWDSPIVGPPFAVPPVPDAAVYDLRSRRRHKPTPAPARARPQFESDARTGTGLWAATRPAPEAVLGSNSFAVAGTLTADGGALVANDMHLTVRVPNTWYRAVLEWQAPGDAGAVHRLAGLTLPGVPALVVGSNGYLAWGFTNTYADWADIVLLEIDPANPRRYRTPEGWRDLEAHDEVIAVAGEEDVHERVLWTIWGPLLPPDHKGRLRAFRWVAHAAERLAGATTNLEDAHTVEDAFDLVNGLGTPGQNFVVADRSGRIGWTIWGSLPRRVGFDGRIPVSWADGARRWDGWLSPGEYPRVLDPPSGRLWTANARVVDGEMLARLGDGSYEVGSRASIIRDRLKARDRFTARDLLNIQLDTRADFLSRWRTLMLDTLDNRHIMGHPLRAELRDALEASWTGEASPDSAAYRLTRMFREEVSTRVMTFVLAECYDADPAFTHLTLRRREGAVWKLVTERPSHLLDPAFASWDDLLLAAMDDVIDAVAPEGPLAERAWFEYNITAYRHPLSPSLPFVGRLLDMPRIPMPGDLFTPRVHWGALAASERMVVSPGHEDTGILHMPTGQSGHPLSPFYSNSHDAWVKGEPAPFLPGTAVHVLTLTP